VEVWLREIYPRLRGANEVTLLTWNTPGETKLFEGLYGVATQSIPDLGRGGLPPLRGAMEFYSRCVSADLVYCVNTHVQAIRLSSLFEKLSLTPFILGHHSPSDWVNEWVFPWIRATHVLKWFSAHHVLNRESKRYLEQIGAKNVNLIPNGVTLKNYGLSPKQDTFTILFVGRLVEVKGVDLIPILVNQLLKRVPVFRFDIVGKGPLEYLFLNNNRVNYLGFVSDELKRLLYQRSHVLVMPSRMETFSLVGLEAMASGTPVVASDIPGPREYIKNGFNGYLVRGVKEMVERVCEVYTAWRRGDPSYYELCRNARRTAEEYDWDRVVPRLERMFREVARGATSK